jgi:hypothetical protein
MNGADVTDSIDGFDTFIGYHARDYARVLPVVHELELRGIRTWIDRLNLPPGRLFQQEIEQVLAVCQSAVVFIGPNGIGPWEKLEVRATIHQFIRRGLPVIPVFLTDTDPDAESGPPLPLFLSEFRSVWINADDPVPGIDDLVWGIKGIRQPPRT